MPTHSKLGQGHHTSRCKHWSGPSLRPQGSMFRQYSGSGTVSGRFWGPRGVQIPLTLELKAIGRWRPRVPDELFGTLLPADRANFGGSPRAQSYMVRPGLVDTSVGRPGRRRSLPFRPYLHARITRITSVEQLPQIIIIIIITLQPQGPSIGSCYI